MKKTVLILIDIQNDYFPGGKMELENPEKAALEGEKLLLHFRSLKWPIIHIRHMAPPENHFLVENSPGSQIHEKVAPQSGEMVLHKRFPNSFSGTGLHELLTGLEIKRLVVSGMMTFMCVDSTVREAFDLGYETYVAHDACAARKLQFGDLKIPANYVHGAFMAALGLRFAKILSADDFIRDNVEKV